MLAIGLIAAVVYLFNATQKTRQLALDKGADDDDLFFFAVFLWLYVVPPVVMLFMRCDDILLVVILAGLYVPGIFFSRKLALKLATGYDYERKAGKDYDKAMWLGYAGIGLVLLGWLLTIPWTLASTHS
jgi:hypothetical protein